MALDKVVKSDISNRMGYHPANPSSAVSHDAARKTVIAATLELVALPMDARHRSVVITKMEEALMWANKGIALGEQGSPVSKDAAVVAPPANRPATGIKPGDLTDSLQPFPEANLP